jgi:hypothetical protein
MSAREDSSRPTPLEFVVVIPEDEEKRLVTVSTAAASLDASKLQVWSYRAPHVCTSQISYYH